MNNKNSSHQPIPSTVLRPNYTQAPLNRALRRALRLANPIAPFLQDVPAATGWNTGVPLPARAKVFPSGPQISPPEAVPDPDPDDAPVEPVPEDDVPPAEPVEAAGAAEGEGAAEPVEPAEPAEPPPLIAEGVAAEAAPVGFEAGEPDGAPPATMV